MELCRPEIHSRRAEQRGRISAYPSEERIKLHIQFETDQECCGSGRPARSELDIMDDFQLHDVGDNLTQSGATRRPKR